MKKRFVMFILIFGLVMAVISCSKEEEGRKTRDERKKSEKEENDDPEGKLTQDVDISGPKNDVAVSLNSDKYIVYIKDRELYCYNIETKETKQMTSGYGVESTNSDLKSRPMPMMLANDGKTLLFSDAKGKGGSLYVCNLEKPIETTKLVGESVSDYYFMNDSGTMITYTTRSPRELYQYDVANDTNVLLGALDNDGDIQTSYDGDTIAYIVDGTLYIKKIGEERQVIFNDVEGIYSLDNNLEKILFVVDSEKMDDVWCCYEKGKGVVELGEQEIVDAYVKSIDENGNTYFCKSKNITGTKKELKNYIDNGFNAVKGYHLAVASEIGNSAEINEDDIPIEIPIVDLYYSHDGINELIGSDVYIQNMLNAHTKPMIAFRETSSGNFFVAFGTKKELVTDKAVVASTFNMNENVLYYLTKDEGTEDIGTIYKVDINNNSIGKPIKLYENVLISVFIENSLFSKNYIIGTLNKDCLYYYKKSVSENELQLYLNNSFVQNVSTSHKILFELEMYFYYEDAPVLYFIPDYDKNTKSFSLYAFNGKTIKIADDVCNIKLTPEGNLLYMKNYNSESCLGELYYFYDGKSEKIDENVIPPTDLMYTHYVLKVKSQIYAFSVGR